MEKFQLDQQIISQLNDEFSSYDLPVVAECAQKVANHLQRNMARNPSETSLRTLSDRQAFVQQIVTYCAISGN